MKRFLSFAAVLALVLVAVATATAEIGEEVSMPRRLADGEEFEVPIQTLVTHGRDLFGAMWTDQEGGGRPLTKGTGAPLSDPDDPLVFPRNFNRISAPDANSCAGCHNAPFGVPGGGGDIVANVFVLGQRFDFATFGGETIPVKGGLDEGGGTLTLDTIGNSRATTGMFGGGYLEMLARQMTRDLQQIRDGVAPGASAPLVTKGVSFGVIARGVDGSWDLDGVEGLPAPSTRSVDGAPPSLVVMPWHQASAVVSLRQFSNNAYNHHHGIQTSERFGDGTDPDGDGFVDEMSRADVTAVSVYQAVLPPPGRVIPRDREIEAAVWNGEQKFAQIGCTNCHVSALPLDNWGWVYTEPNPYNPPGNLQVGEAPTLQVNLNSKVLPGQRLREQNGVTWVEAYTDMKLHDITSGLDDPNREPLNMHFAAGSEEFIAGNSKFLTKRLWGAANEPPYFHHGKFTTMRQAVLAHAGEAQAVTDAYLALSKYDQDSIIEFLKTLQVLPEGAHALIVDEKGRARPWPPRN